MRYSLEIYRDRIFDGHDVCEMAIYDNIRKRFMFELFAASMYGETQNWMRICIKAMNEDFRFYEREVYFYVNL